MQKTVHISVGQFTDAGFDGYDDVDKHNVQISNTLSKLAVSARINRIEPDFMLCEQLADVKMGSALDSLEDRSFACCQHIRSIQMPYGIRKIGSNAFLKCENLDSIKIDKGSTQPMLNVFDFDFVGENAFSGCKWEETILDFTPEAEIGSQIFANCEQLSSASVTRAINLPSQIFLNCRKLERIQFFDCDFLKQVSNSVFDQCESLISVRFPDLISEYDDMAGNALAGSSLLSVWLDGFTYEELQKIGIREKKDEVVYEPNPGVQLGKIYLFDWDKVKWCLKNSIPCVFVKHKNFPDKIYKRTRTKTGYISFNYYIQQYLNSMSFREWLSDKPAVFFKTNSIEDQDFIIKKVNGVIQNKTYGSGFLQNTAPTLLPGNRKINVKMIPNEYGFSQTVLKDGGIYRKRGIQSKWNGFQQVWYYNIPDQVFGHIIDPESYLLDTNIFKVEECEQYMFKLPRRNFGCALAWYWKKPDKIIHSALMEIDQTISDEELEQMTRVEVFRLMKQEEDFKLNYDHSLIKPKIVKYVDKRYFLYPGGGGMNLFEESCETVRKMSESAIIDDIKKGILDVVKSKLKCMDFKGIDQVKIQEIKTVYYDRNAWGIGHKCRFICKDGRYVDYEPVASE